MLLLYGIFSLFVALLAKLDIKMVCRNNIIGAPHYRNY